MFLYVTNLDAFASTPLAAEDSNSGFGVFKRLARIRTARCWPVFYRGACRRILMAPSMTPAISSRLGARLNSNVEDDRTVGGIDDEMLAAAGAMSDRVALGHGSE